jgi:hypothetical protein
MPFVAQYADDFRGKGFIQKLDDSCSVGLIPFRNGAVLDVLSRPPAKFLNVRQEGFFVRFICHIFLLCEIVRFGN